MAQPYEPRRSGKNREAVRLVLFVAGLLLCGGCGLDHYEQKMEAEQKRLKYLDEENQYLDAGSLKFPEKKGEDKEPVPDKDFFFRPPKGIPTTPEPKPYGILYRYPSSNASGGIQELLVAVAKKDSTDKFRNDVLQNLVGLGLRAAGSAGRDVGGQAGRLVHYDSRELQSGPNQPSSYVYFYREQVQGEGTYQVAIVFRGVSSSQGGTANDNVAIEFSLASLLVDGAARTKYGSLRLPSQPGPGSRR